MKTINESQWELVYDYQQVDDWDKKSVTVRVWNSKVIECQSLARVDNDITKEIKSKIFSKETCESDALRWANDISNKIMFEKSKK